MANTNITSLGTASAESYQGGHEPARAIDGNLTTDWGSGKGVPVWWQISFEDTHSIAEVRISFNTNINYTYTLLGSVDESSWDTLHEATYGIHTDDVITNLSGNYKYLRISITQSSGWSTWSNLMEVEVYSKPPVFKYAGFVKQEGESVSRDVRLYNRTTGALMASTTSSAVDGYFEITANEDVVCYALFLPEPNQGYEIIVRDNISLLEVEE